MVPGANLSIGGVLIGQVLTVDSGTQVTLNVPVPVAYVGTGIGLNFSGGTSLTLSQAATGTNATVTLTVAGGTPTAPLYGAGNTNGNALASVPTCVGQFNARAYFGVTVSNQPGTVFTDPNNVRQVTNATQALTFANGVAATAFAGLGLAQLFGGTLQSLLVFQNEANIQQITGDPTTNNLALNNLGSGTGTFAPNTIAQTPFGVM